MSLLPEVADKLGNFVENFFDFLKANVEELYPGLAPEEQEKQVFLQTTNIHTTCVTRSGLNMCGTVTPHQSMIQACLFKFDLTLTKDNFSISDPVNMGKINGTNWQHLNAAEIEYVENELIVPWTTKEHYSVNKLQSGVLTAKISTSATNRITLGVYDTNNILHADWVNQSFLTTWGTTWQSGTYLDIAYNVVEYTTAGGYVTVNFSEPDYNINDLYPNSSKIFGLKSYPFVGNFKDQTFINRYITDNGATNNYHHTYTTQDNKNIEVYYGDNYIIYYTDDDEPVSYNDVKNAFNIAINQINDDNDTDIPPAPPFTPPSPEPVTDDDYVDMGLGVETDGMAMYNMAVITRDELIQLITDFEANADTGLSFIPHVLGLYKLGFESSQLLTTASDKIRLHKEPSKTAFNSADNYNIVQNQEVLIDCGSITVDREELLTNTFLDFSPYTTYEMFIPGCGWITLPDTIVGRTISVSIVFDLTTCSCKGVVRSEGKLLGGSGTTLATVNGIIGSSVPLSINETGLQRAAIMNGSTQAAMALGTAFMGVGIGNPYMGASGVAMAASALASNHIAGNSTYTSTKGGATDYSIFGDGWKAVLKITRPVLEIPDNYGHSVGFVVNRYAQLSEFSGFTVCVNPHIHISATSDEKEEIKRLLEEGVILPEGE